MLPFAEKRKAEKKAGLGWVVNRVFLGMLSLSYLLDIQGEGWRELEEAVWVRSTFGGSSWK